MQESLFYVFGALTVAAALAVVASRNPVNSALAMILALGGVAANFFLLDAAFLGVLQLLVYAGAVMVLFVFVIMLLDAERDAARRRSKWRVLTGVVLVGITAAAAWALGGAVAERQAAGDTTTAVDTAQITAGTPQIAAGSAGKPAVFPASAKTYGRLLFTKYMLLVQVAGLLLLAAMVAVVVISKRRQNVAAEIAEADAADAAGTADPDRAGGATI
jgi:NADH-quinone oxidoreductase subunit J